MIFGAARVAPEKAVFRPALPMSFQPGISEMQMATMTYKEQLLHPLWQQKRLQVLEAAGWQCRACGTKEITLHVHHKKYVKGRKAWEYELSELECLCKNCHQTEHGKRELLDRLLSAGNNSLDVAIGLLAGYLEGALDISNDDADHQAALEVAEPWMRLGLLASLVDPSPAACLRAAQACGSSPNPAHEDAMAEWEEHVEYLAEHQPRLLVESAGFKHECCDHLQHVASFVPVNGNRNRDSVASLIAGYCGHDMSSPYVGDPAAHVAGEVAQLLEERCFVSELAALRPALRARDVWTVTAAVADFALDLQTRPNAPEQKRGML